MAFCGMSIFHFQCSNAQAQTNSNDLLKKMQEGTLLEKLDSIDQLGHLTSVDSAVTDALIAGLGHSDLKIRLHCARALGWIGPNALSAGKALRDSMADSDLNVRIQAAKAIGLIGDNSDGTVTALVEMVAGKDRSAARAAIEALRSMEVNKKVVVEAFGKCLCDDEHSTVIHAVEALVERGKDATPILLESLKNDQGAYWVC